MLDTLQANDVKPGTNSAGQITPIADSKWWMKNSVDLLWIQSQISSVWTKTECNRSWRASRCRPAFERCQCSKMLSPLIQPYPKSVTWNSHRWDLAFLSWKSQTSTNVECLNSVVAMERYDTVWIMHQHYLYVCSGMAHCQYSLCLRWWPSNVWRWEYSVDVSTTRSDSHTKSCNGLPCELVRIWLPTTFICIIAYNS